MIDLPREFLRTSSIPFRFFYNFYSRKSFRHLEMFQWILRITAIPGGKTGMLRRREWMILPEPDSHIHGVW